MSLVKTHANEPLKKCHNDPNRHQNRVLCMVREESEDYLIIDRAVAGVKVAECQTGHLRNVGTCRSDANAQFDMVNRSWRIFICIMRSIAEWQSIIQTYRSSDTLMTRYAIVTAGAGRASENYIGCLLC